MHVADINAEPRISGLEPVRCEHDEELVVLQRLQSDLDHHRFDQRPLLGQDHLSDAIGTSLSRTGTRATIARYMSDTRWIRTPGHDVGMADGSDDPARTGAQQTGDAAETLVAARLAAAGWTVLARNVHVGRYELDIVAVDPGPPTALVIAEVRWRASRSFGLPEETVDHRKRARVRAAAFGLLDRGALPDGAPLPRLPLRFDLIVVEPGDRVRHHRHAM